MSEGLHHFPPGSGEARRSHEVLGVSPDADAAVVRNAFKKLALIHHPDQGGDADAFKEINRAQEHMKDWREGRGKRPSDQDFKTFQEEIKRNQTEQDVLRAEALRRRAAGSHRAWQQSQNNVNAGKGISVPPGNVLRNAGTSPGSVPRMHKTSGGELLSEKPLDVLEPLPETAKFRATRFYDELSWVTLRYENQDKPDYLVGKKAGKLYLVDPKTYKRLSSGYDKFLKRDRKTLVGVRDGAEYLLDQKTGKELSSGGHDRVERRDAYGDVYGYRDDLPLRSKLGSSGKSKPREERGEEMHKKPETDKVLSELKKLVEEAKKRGRRGS
ncbi:MAG: J domain-containing protein [Minisyncoccia bacterium]